MLSLPLAFAVPVAATPPDHCRYFETFRRAGVPAKPLRQALTFVKDRSHELPRRDWISIADYGAPSTTPRFYMLNLQTGQVIRERVSHGSGHQRGVKRGDPDHDGRLDRCRWRGRRTNMTRPGFFRTAELYRSQKHTRFRRVNGQRVRQWPFIDRHARYNGLRLDGLTPGINGHARRRGVVMHGAWYNDLRPIMGRSYGCPAFASDRAPDILERIKGGTLYYAYTPQCHHDQRVVDRQVEGWTSTCSSP